MSSLRLLLSTHLPSRRVLAFIAIFGFLLCGPESSLACWPEHVKEARSSDVDPTVERINQLIEQSWTEYSLKPSKDATDGEWCRRIYLDVIGRIPTVQELDAFTRDNAGDKKQRLVQKLLYDDEYTEEFARNWTTIWTNLLIGRTGGTDNRSMISRDGMQKYLRDSFARNKPLDKFAYELITATGSTTPGEDNFNGATNFVFDLVEDVDHTVIDKRLIV